MVVTAWLSFTSSLVNRLQPSKKAGIFSVTPIFIGQLILKNLNKTERYNFLSKIDLGYAKLIKLTAPDGTMIHMKAFQYNMMLLA